MKGVILVDTREQDLHILKDLDRLGIQYKRKKLNFGDYSFEIDGASYENCIVVERKGSITEIIGNFTKGRERFRKEFERAKGSKVILMIEDSLERLNAHEYRSRMTPSDVLKFLKTWAYKFQLDIRFVDKKDACKCILDCFRDYYRKEIKHE
jgi:ERCC4-type nuclease